MKSKRYIYIQVLTMVFLTILLLFNSFTMYGQETKENAIVSLSFSDETDPKTITARITDQTDLPIEELELYFYVQRTFSLLPLGDGFNETDENGMVEIEFPNDLPGDAEGNLTIIVKIVENDLYNDLSIETIKKWGIPTFINEAKHERSLWAAAANAPITLIVSVSGMILVVWFIILYIIFTLYKISKIEPLKS